MKGCVNSMAKTIIAKNTNVMPRSEWLNLRRKGIGGSDAAAACGLSRWKSPLQLFIEKTSTIRLEADNERMAWGRTLEPVIRTEFSKRTGLSVQECPFMFAFQEYPFMIANIDGIVTEKDGNKALLEIKTVGEHSAKDWEDGLPLEYYLQIQHYIAVCDLNKAYCAVLIGGNKFSYQVVDRDDETIHTIIALESDFWLNHVMKGVAPVVTDKDAELLNTLYPQSNATTAILPQSADAIISDYLELKTLEDNLKQQKSEIENKLKTMLGDKESAVSSTGYTVSWKSVQSSKFDTTRLKAEHPDIVKAYTTTSSFRRFCVTAPNSAKA